jgi:hypothetical protein
MLPLEPASLEGVLLLEPSYSTIQGAGITLEPTYTTKQGGESYRLSQLSLQHKEEVFPLESTTSISTIGGSLTARGGISTVQGGGATA